MIYCFERDIDVLVVIEKDHLHYYLFYSNQQQAAITSFMCGKGLTESQTLEIALKTVEIALM